VGKIHRLNMNGQFFHGLFFTCQNGVIASGGKDRNIKLWSSATDKAIKTPVTVLQNISVVKTLWLSNDAQQVISGGGDGAVRVFKLTGTEHTKKGPVQNWGLAWEKKIHEDAISALVGQN
jgi:WD40 repeat protein